MAKPHDELPGHAVENDLGPLIHTVVEHHAAAVGVDGDPVIVEPELARPEKSVLGHTFRFR